MTLTKYGMREWLIISAVMIALIVLIVWLLPWWAATPIVIVWIGLLLFFRDPVRTIPDNLPAGVMLSPADGVISAIEHVDEHEATNGPAVIIRIFLSVLDVHVNRWPHDGTVLALKHTPGKYLNAQTEESAIVNESNLITLQLPWGERAGVRQVAGMIARRIVCPLEPGMQLRRGQKFGMIKFGSTTELILPRPGVVRVHVKPGEKVCGGSTLLATIALPDATSD